ncbi:MAG: DUF1501 domain-containing protein [Candidatus Hydrogenedentes bacterium]|nr:DUF1501 domain-containing protein [Candidatus Hydrogenedentota bacterium]
MPLRNSIGRALGEQLLSRRGFLSSAYTGLAGVGLTTLLAPESLGGARAFAATEPNLRVPQFAPRAKRVLQIFCPGAASHMDLWEHKPALDQYHGTPLPGEENMLSFQGKNGNIMKSPWPFAPAGECGKMLSTMLPHIAQHVDDIAFVHSMTSKTNTHGPGCVFMNTGHTSEGFPSAGAWISYALGSENENLPAYVCMPDIRGEPPNGKANWSNGFLPAEHQGVVLSAQQPVRNLETPEAISADEEAATRAFIAEANTQHAIAHPGESELRARMAAYELAARMQLSAPEVTTLDGEPRFIHDLYGTNDSNTLKASYARNCLLARRLLERGVRCVNLYCASRASGVDGLLNWDAHKTLKADYERHCPIFDQPTGALLADLKQRGMLEETLVLWTTEFGRMPTHQEGTTGRDHNPDGFTCWMMGAGVKGGTSFGATDEFGRRAVVNPVTVWDYYATALHLLGFNHEQLTYYYNGLDRRLTDVHGFVIRDLLA